MATKLINTTAEEYLRSLAQGLEAESSIADIDEHKEQVSTVTKKGKKWVSATLTSHKTAMLTFAQLEKSKLLADSLEKNKNALDFYSWQDLDLLCGNQANPDKNVHAHVDRTQTMLGKCVLAATLVTPSTTQEEIVKKQEIAKVLCENVELKEALQEELSHIKENEGKRAALWSDASPLKHPAYNEELKGGFYQISLAPPKVSLWRPSSTSASKLQWVKRLSDFLHIYLLGILFIALGYFYYSLIPVYTSLGSTPSLLWVSYCFSILFSCWVAYRQHERKNAVICFLAEYMSILQTCVKTAHNIYKLVMAHPRLKALYKDELKAVDYLWKLREKENNLGKMMRALQGPSWKNWKYFRSPTGQLLAAYTVFEQHKNIFANAFYEIGKLDVHLSTASLLLESQEKNAKNSYVLSKVLSPKKKDDVVVKGERIWHPGLAPEVVVPNDLSLDAQQGNRLILITGPNMGGKSTYILSSGLAALLSQCLGIAPAKSFTHTCFKKFMTYVNPSQNLARGLSLAGAAFEVLKTHKEVLATTEGPVFAIIDEILNGVDAKMGLDVSKETLKSRHEKYPNCVTLLTTHYMKLSELDKLPGVANKHVEAIVKGKGVPIEFTYKILDGISTQNIVKDIVSNMGIIDEII